MIPFQPAELSFSITITMLLVIFQANSFNAENECNRSCPNSNFSRPLPFPFGFSSGCRIQLNCDSTGVTIGDFTVLNITSEDIIVHLPASCDRRLASISVLFGKNYAPSSATSFLLQSCSKSLQSPCELRLQFLEKSLKPKSCNGKSDNISCFTVSDGQRLLSYDEVRSTQCHFLFSSTSIVTRDSALSLELGRANLGWWHNGNCSCDENANCTHVTQGKNRTVVGYRCLCNKGYEGDGFKAGGGCRRGESILAGQ